MHSYDYYKVYKQENFKLEDLEKQFNFAPVDLDTLDKIYYLEKKVRNLKKKIGSGANLWAIGYKCLPCLQFT